RVAGPETEDRSCRGYRAAEPGGEGASIPGRSPAPARRRSADAGGLPASGAPPTVSKSAHPPVRPPPLFLVGRPREAVRNSSRDATHVYEVAMPQIRDGQVATSVGAVTDPEEWVDRYGDGLYRYELSRLRSADLAADLVQETFLEALRARRCFAGRSSEWT